MTEINIESVTLCGCRQLITAGELPIHAAPVLCFFFTPYVLRLLLGFWVHSATAAQLPGRYFSS